MRDEPRIRPFRRRPTRGIALVVVLAGACMPLAADSAVVTPSCDQVPKVENAFLKFTSQDSAVVDCHRGFVLHGSDDMTCTVGRGAPRPSAFHGADSTSTATSALQSCEAHRAHPSRDLRGRQLVDADAAVPRWFSALMLKLPITTPQRHQPAKYHRRMEVQ